MDKNKLIDYLIKEKGGTREQYLSLLNGVAYHESAGTMDPTIKQHGGGPGRGKYQFEAGKHRGGITAARRTKRYLESIGEQVPEWLQEVTKENSLDASQLTSEQQDVLFLGNIRMHPKADFSNYVSGKEPIDQFWANYHWAGADKDRGDRLASFNESLKHFDPTYKNSKEYGPPPREERLAQVDNTFVAPKIDYSKVKFAGKQDEVFNIVPDAKKAVEQYEKEQQKKPMDDIVAHIKQRAMSGQGQFNEINNGGTHGQNPYGGVPHGIGANGQMNTVEQGETSFNFGDDKFIFSNRISLTDYLNQKKTKTNPNEFALGGNMNAPIPALNPTDPVKPVKKTPPNRVAPGLKVDSLDAFLFNTQEGQRESKFVNPMDILTGNNKGKYDALDNRFSEIHADANKSCLAGAMNCSQEFVQGNSGLPGLRTIIANSGTDSSKYKIRSKPKSYLPGDYVDNQSIDAWEIHDYLVGENLGYSLFQKDDTTKYGNGILPEGFDYTSIPLGAVIGQGNSADAYTLKEDGERSRHAMTVVGFDHDGMPMVYDFGKLTRLDDPFILGKDYKVNRITVPNDYKGYTKSKIENLITERKKELNLYEAPPVQYGSDKPHIKAIESGVNEVRDQIAYNYGIPSKTINKFAQYLPGLAHQESKINNNEGTSKSAFADNFFGNNVAKPIIKTAGDLWDSTTNLFKEEGEYKQDYQLEIEAFEKFGEDREKIDEYIRKGQEQRGSVKKKVAYQDNVKSSVGPFAIKDIPEYAKTKLGIEQGDLYGATVSNEEELINGSKVALAYLADNYTKFKKKYPDLTDDQLVNLTIVSYNNKSKTEDPKFIKHYIKGNKLSDAYLSSVTGYNPKEDNNEE